MHERRGDARTTRMLFGKVRFQDISRDCTVLDLSRSGARLKLIGFSGLPEKFDLYVPDRGATYRAHVRWQFGDEIGISFEHAGSGLDESEILPRIEELEMQVAELRKLLAEVLERGRDTDAAA
jgi:hypothetical protein